MRDNVNNYWGTAPDKGSMKGPVLGHLNSSEVAAVHKDVVNLTNSDDYWLSTLGSAGMVRSIL